MLPPDGSGYLVIEDGVDTHEFGNAGGSQTVRAKMVIKDESAYRDIAFGGSMGGAELPCAGALLPLRPRAIQRPASTTRGRIQSRWAMTAV